jgi:hypothetical protein
MSMLLHKQLGCGAVVVVLCGGKGTTETVCGHVCLSEPTRGRGQGKRVQVGE